MGNIHLMNELIIITEQGEVKQPLNTLNSFEYLNKILEQFKERMKRHNEHSK